MKKLISILLTFTMLISLSVYVLANPSDKTNPNANDNANTTVSEKKAQLEQMKEEFRLYQNQLKENRKKAIDNLVENNKLNAQNNILREDLQLALEHIMQENIEISQSILDLLNENSKRIGQLTQELRSTQNGLGNLINKNNNFAKEKDYEAMNLAFEQIYEIQSYRNTCLEQINELIMEMIRELAGEI